MQDFDLIGLQRHLKVLGLFCRLYHRDGKAGYLKDLPRVRRYVHAAARNYRSCRPCAASETRAANAKVELVS